MDAVSAFITAAACTILCLYYIGEKITEVDLYYFLPRNRKRAKLKRLRAKRATPLHGMGLHKEIKNSFEKVLIPLGKSDLRLLPSRMDMNFRKQIELQIQSLEQRKLRRDIRVTDVVPTPKNDFKHWSDDGREWRESILQCSSLDRFVSAKSGRSVKEIYHKNACLRILQSRHVRNSDRAGKKSSYYAESTTINCPSCGAEVELTGQQTVCPYCGGVIQSDFYDWQTEAFELYEEPGPNLRRLKLLLAGGWILFICLFLALWLIKNTLISLTVGVVSAILILMSKGSVRAAQSYDEALVRQCQRLNGRILSRATGKDALGVLASPVIGGGIGVSQMQQLLILGADSGTIPLEVEPLAKYLATLLTQIGANVTLKDKGEVRTFDSPEGLKEARLQAERFLAQLPIYRALKFLE